MPRAHDIQNIFNAGEFSELLDARSDFAKFSAAVAQLENWLPQIHGGATRRPGTRYVAEIKDSSKKGRLIPFEFSTEQAYIIELGEKALRFFRNSGQLNSEDTDASIANGAFGSDITSWTARNSGTGSIAWDGTNLVMDITSAAAGNEGRAYQAVTIGASFQANLHVLKFRVFLGELKLRIGTTVGGEEILVATTMKKGWHCQEFTPNAGTIYIEFESAESTSSSLDDVSLIDNAPVEIDSPYLEADLFQIQYAQSADVIWMVHNGHKPMKLTRRGNASWDLIDYAPTSDPFTSADNFPTSVSFIEQRIAFGGTLNALSTLYLSKSADFEDMTEGTTDADAFVLAIASGRVNVIEWTVGTDRGLLIGTAGGEYTLSGQINEPLTPTNFLIRERTVHGARPDVLPVRVDNSVIFLQRSGKKVREFVFDFTSDSFRAPDLIVLGEHLTRNRTITDMAFKQEPTPRVWCVGSDGVLLALTINRAQDVVAWSPHKLGGSFGSTAWGIAESVASIPHPDQDKDQLWITVKRTIDGATKRYVEFFGESESRWADYKQLGLDSAITGGVFDPKVSLVSGIDHLEAETVGILGDRAVYTDQVVSSGQVTGLTPTVADAEVGLNFTSTIKTLKPELQLGGGTIQGLIKQLPKITVRMFETLGIKIEAQELGWRAVADPMDAPESLFTGDKSIVRLGADISGQITITQALPLPATILAIMYTIDVESA
jgi:hypothetical protein